MTLSNQILEALNHAPDYSEQFTARIAALASEISATVSLPVTHDTDMNYRHGQSLSFTSAEYIDRRHSKQHQSEIEVRIYVSSRGNLFAFYCFDVRHAFIPAGTLNHPMPMNLIPSYTRTKVESCRRLLEQCGYIEIPSSLFKEPAPGCTTNMDDLPANLFEALFAEVV